MSKLCRDSRGASAIEFAIAVPVLIVFIYGIFMIGLVFAANAGLQHALGEGARYATIFPTPTDEQLQARITDKKFALAGGTFDPPTIDNSQVANGYKTISLTFRRPTNFLLVRGPTVTITRSKKVYLAETPST